MKKLTYLFAFFAFIAATVGIIIAAVSFFERRKELLSEDGFDDEYYCGQDYYEGDLSFDGEEKEVAEKE